MLLSSCSALASVAFGPQVAWRLGALWTSCLVARPKTLEKGDCLIPFSFLVSTTGVVRAWDG